MNDSDDEEDFEDGSNGRSEEERDKIRKFREQMLSSLEGQFSSSIEDDDDDDFDDDEITNSISRNIPTPTELEDEEGIDELIRFASSLTDKNDEGKILGDVAANTKKDDWAIPLTASSGNEGSILKSGIVLVANPVKFCTDFLPSESGDIGDKDNDESKTGGGFPFGLLSSIAGSATVANNGNQVSPSLLAKFGLTLPPPAEIGPDRRADLLPVVILVENNNMLTGSQGVLMNRRTGYLIGDLEQQKPPPLNEEGEKDDSGSLKMGPSKIKDDKNYSPTLGAFMIQPLWFGGTSSGGINNDKGEKSKTESAAGGLDMLHMCEKVSGSKKISDDGLFWGGSPVEAQEVMTEHNKENPSKAISGFDFKFYVQSTRWLPTQLEKEVRDGTWFVTSVSKNVLFKSRDRLGTRRGKPLWTEIMELLGPEYHAIRDQLYGETVDE